LDTFMTILEWVLKILAGYTAVMSIFFLIPRKKYPVVPPKTRFAVLLPARNEEKVIGNIIGSLFAQDYPRELFDIYVIPNNCTDDTEGAALRAGAKTLHCPNPVSTKGEVLHQIFEGLMGQYDAYCVFDADNIVDSHFLARMNDAIAAGARVAKSRQCALNPYDNWVSGGYDLYFQSHTILHNLPREHFRLNAKLVGTGFMVTDALLQDMNGWNTVTLTEDIEFAVQCALEGERVYYVYDALTYDEEPLSFAVSMRQRWRWSAGVQSVANKYTGKLMGKKPSWLRWDLASHINMIYVQLLALIPALYGMLRAGLLQTVTAIAVALLGFVGSGILMGLFLSVTGRRDIRKQWKAILMYPVYLASWYPLHIVGLVRKPRSWKPIVHGTAVNRQDSQKSKITQ